MERPKVVSDSRSTALIFPVCDDTAVLAASEVAKICTMQSDWGFIWQVRT